MMPPLENEVRLRFPFLFETLAFTIVDHGDDCGGNIIVAQSDKVRIRFIQDRADFFLDMGCVAQPEKWTGLYNIMDKLRTNGRINIQYKYSNRMGAVSRLLGHCFLDIQEAVLQQAHRETKTEDKE